MFFSEMQFVYRQLAFETESTFISTAWVKHQKGTLFQFSSDTCALKLNSASSGKMTREINMVNQGFTSAQFTSFFFIHKFTRTNN